MEEAAAGLELVGPTCEFVESMSSRAPVLGEEFLATPLAGAVSDSSRQSFSLEGGKEGNARQPPSSRPTV